MLFFSEDVGSCGSDVSVASGPVLDSGDTEMCFEELCVSERKGDVFVEQHGVSL